MRELPRSHKSRVGHVGFDDRVDLVGVLLTRKAARSPRFKSARPGERIKNEFLSAEYPAIARRGEALLPVCDGGNSKVPRAARTVIGDYFVLISP